MVGRWWAEAGKYQVLPIDGSALERLNVERPTIARPRDRFVYYPGGSSVPFTATPKTYNRPWSITADVVIPPGGAEGVLLANGGRTGGYTFFIKDQRVHFLYNWLGRDRFWLHSSEKVPEGEVELALRVRADRQARRCPREGSTGPLPALHQPEPGREHRHALLGPEHVRDAGPDLRL